MENGALCLILVLTIFALLICMLCRALAKEKAEKPGMKFKDFCVWCNERACDGCWERIRDDTGIVEKVIDPIGDVSNYRYTLNFNPKMWLPVDVDTID